MKLCYIGRVPTNWWPRRVLCALWTRRPIVKVAMGCRMEPAAVHIAHVLQRLDFFQFFNFFYNLHDLQQKKKLHDLPQKLKNSIFFYNSHDLQQKKNYTHLQQKKNYTTIRFFCTRLTFFTSYGYHTGVGLRSTHFEDHAGASRRIFRAFFIARPQVYSTRNTTSRSAHLFAPS